MGTLARLGQPLVHGLAGRINRTSALSGAPFDPSTSLAPPSGRYRIGHYGVMVPALPAPLRSLDVIAVIGSPRVPIFDNRPLTAAQPDDTAFLLTGVGGSEYSQFASYSVREDCDLAADGSRLRFGDDLTIEGSYPKFSVRRSHPRLDYTLNIRASDTVTHFVHLRGIYDHWSLLCEYDAGFVRDGVASTASGLCTVEYARAMDLPLRFHFFSYQIVNVSEDTQVLLSEVRAPGGLQLYRGVHVRTLGETSRTYTRGFRNTVHTDDRLDTPDGHGMRVPREWTWGAGDVVRIDARANDDYVYGLGAGFAGSFEYAGTFRGEPISGTGYAEWIER